MKTISTAAILYITIGAPTTAFHIKHDGITSCFSNNNPKSKIVSNHPFLKKQQQTTTTTTNTKMMMMLPDIDYNTNNEIIQSLSNVWDTYNTQLDVHPLITKSVTAGIILGLADWTGQAVERSQKKQQQQQEGGGGGGVDDDDDDDDVVVDLGRVARFAFFGLVLQAPWNHFYYLMLDGALPPTEEPFTTTTGIKVVIDQFIQAPIFTVLIFAFLGLLEGKSLDGVKNQLDDDYVDTMIANWKLWIPATVVNIAFIPPVLRVLYLNVVFFFWSIFLSLKLNKDESG